MDKHYSPLTDKKRGVYVIRRNDGCAQGYDHYVAHGTMNGMEDAIGYGSMEDARKFLSEKETQAYIDHVLPDWASDTHHPARITLRDAGLIMPGLAALIYLAENDAEIPVKLLEPAKGKMLIWMR